MKSSPEGSTARHDSVMSVEDEPPDKTSESDVSIQDQETTQTSPKSVEPHSESVGSSQVSCKVTLVRQKSVVIMMDRMIV